MYIYIYIYIYIIYIYTNTQFEQILIKQPCFPDFEMDVINSRSSLYIHAF